MKLAGLIAILTFGVLSGLQATPIELTATNISFGCQGPPFACGLYQISGPGFEGQMLGGDSAEGFAVFVVLDGYPGDEHLGSTLTVGNTTYGPGSFVATGPEVIAYMTYTTPLPYYEWLSSGPATATGEIDVCFVSALPPSSDGTCDAGLAFAIINLPGLFGTFSEVWSGNQSNSDAWGGSLSTSEPLTAGIAFAGLLLLVAYGKCQSKGRWALRDRFTVSLSA